MIYISDPDFTLHVGDVLDVLRDMPDESVHCCVTSPPYWGLRDYGCDGQLGLEATPEEYVAGMVDVFREVRRVLRADGTCWLNIGDSYASATKGSGGLNSTTIGGGRGQGSSAGSLYGVRRLEHGVKEKDLVGIPWRLAFALQADGWYLRSDIIWAKPNPMPESVTDRPTKAHEYLFLLSRSPRYFYDADAIAEPAAWERWGDQTIRKPQPGKGSWLLPKTKAELDETVRPRVRKKPLIPEQTKAGVGTQGVGSSTFGHFADGRGRNKRSVWEIATESYPEAHFATFPQALVEPCIKAGTSERGCCPECGAPWARIVEKGPAAPEPEHRGGVRLAPGQAGNVGTGAGIGARFSKLSGQEQAAWKAAHPDKTTGWRATCDHGHDPVAGVVLDPFMGSGTTAIVARRLGRKSVGIELNPTYADLAARRLSQLSLLAEEAA